MYILVFPFNSVKTEILAALFIVVLKIVILHFAHFLGCLHLSWTHSSLFELIDFWLQVGDNFLQIVLLLLLDFLHYLVGLWNYSFDSNIAFRFLGCHFYTQMLKFLPHFCQSALGSDFLADSVVDLGAFALRLVLNSDFEFLLFSGFISVVFLNQYFSYFLLHFRLDLLKLGVIQYVSIEFFEHELFVGCCQLGPLLLLQLCLQKGDLLIEDGFLFGFDLAELELEVCECLLELLLCLYFDALYLLGGDVVHFFLELGLYFCSEFSFDLCERGVTSGRNSLRRSRVSSS